MSAEYLEGIIRGLVIGGSIMLVPVLMIYNRLRYYCEELKARQSKLEEVFGKLNIHVNRTVGITVDEDGRYYLEDKG